MECVENIAPQETDCNELNCSVVSIDPVEEDQYFIDGEDSIILWDLMMEA